AAGATVPLLFRALASPTAGPGGAEDARFGAALEPRIALYVSTLTGAFLASEPFLVAHARTFQLDSTATSTVWIGTLCAVLALLERRVAFALAAGACLGIAMLTRMLSGVFAAGLGCAFLGVFVLGRARDLRLLVLLAIFAATTALTVVLLWPALWTTPLEAMSEVLRASRQTVGRGHVELSWGSVHRRDPGAAFYAGVVLMRLTPEVLAFGVVSLALAWRMPRRTWLVLALVACAYLPPAAALLLSAKKADRYALLFFPLFTLLAIAGLVDLARRLPLRGRLAERGAAVALVAAGVLLVARLARVAAVHPVPIAWCATYPGLRCEEVITLGQGEGFRDAALWIAENSPVQNPSILSAYAGGAVLAPWLRFQRVRDPEKAHFILTYIASEQRDADRTPRSFAVGEPLHQVIYQGRTYVNIFMGPAHPDAAVARRRGRRSH
ncbi:MAG TPA: hypothetical protein VF103_06720, partial [Polyangiaceae bacterium]